MDTIVGKDLEQAAVELRSGQLVAIPTETVYGLAGNALDERAVLEIFSVKNRPAFDPLIVHVPNVKAVSRYVSDIPPSAKKLMEAFWPGPLTLLLTKKSIIPDIVTSGLDTVGMRMPSHPLTLELLNQLDFPLAAPSANPFGYISPVTAKHVKDQLDGRIKYILDGGRCEVGVESTIVGFQDDVCTVYRLGGITVEELMKVVPNVEINTGSGIHTIAPGMLKSHYAPRKPLFFGKSKDLIFQHKDKKFALLYFHNPPVGHEKSAIKMALSDNNDYKEAAHNLFSFLRMLDAENIDCILAESVPDEGLGRAINDRLHRASVKD